ncbi:MAG: nuclear transport factor 2 family protein [Anaerolineae bacterium]|jgi:ketosteroid isomerase-like protein
MDVLSSVSIVRTFVEYVNAGDLKRIASLISDDVKFTDIQGRVYREKGFMAGYLSEFPEYRILVQHMLQGGQGVAIVGQTTGSHVPPEIEERETLVWTAEVRDGLITEWRIYSDLEYAAKS